MSDETDRFLASLYKRAKQDDEDPEDVAKRIWQNNRGIDRRTLMQAGALGAGGLMGGAGAMTATQNASADPSTSDNDGNVGTPSDPVDAFIEGWQMTGESLLAWGDNTWTVQSYSIGTDAGQAVKDAISDLGTAGGRIVLPAGVDIPWQQEVDLSGGNPNLNDGTALIIEGHGDGQGPSDSNNRSGTLLDCSSLGTGETAVTNSGIARNIELRDLAFRGRTDSNTGTSSEPDGIAPGNDMSLRRVGFYQFDTGINASNALIDVDWTVTASNCVTGISASTANVTESRLEFRVRSCTATPAAHLGPIKSSRVNPYVESNESDGLYIENLGPDSRLVDGHFEQNADGGAVSKAVDLWLKQAKAATVGPAIFTNPGGANDLAAGDYQIRLGVSGVTPVVNTEFENLQTSSDAGDVVDEASRNIGFHYCDFNGEDFSITGGPAFYLNNTWNGSVSSKGQSGKFTAVETDNGEWKFHSPPRDLSFFNNPEQGDVANAAGNQVTEGRAYFDGATWISLVDQTTYTP